MSRGGAALQKSSGEHCAWDAVASSSECIVGLQSSRRGLRCKVQKLSDPISGFRQKLKGSSYRGLFSQRGASSHLGGVFFPVENALVIKMSTCIFFFGELIS